MPSGSSPSSVDDEQLGKPVGGRNSRLVDAGFAVDPDPDAHAALGHGEQRCGSAGQRAAAERYAERSGAFVRESGHALDLIDRVAGFGCTGRRLEDREVPAMPRRLCFSAIGALAMSSVTTTVRQSTPAGRSFCCAW